MKNLRMILLCFGASLLLISGGRAFTTPIVLDFTSGTYSAQNQANRYINKYSQDGFIVRTASCLDYFSTIFGEYGPDLVWYNRDIIIVSRAQGNFSLESVDLPVPAYAGLTFTSSKLAGLNAVGNGTKYFSGPGWTDISSFTITTQIKSFDILTE